MLTREGAQSYADTAGVFQVPGSAPKRFLSLLGSEDASPAGVMGAAAPRGPGCAQWVGTGTTVCQGAQWLRWICVPVLLCTISLPRLFQPIPPPG